MAHGREKESALEVFNIFDSSADCIPVTEAGSRPTLRYMYRYIDRDSSDDQWTRFAQSKCQIYPLRFFPMLRSIVTC